MKINTGFFIITFFCLLACVDSTQKNSDKFNTLKSEVKSNYVNKNSSFQELNKCFAFKYIKVIEFKNKDAVEINYKMSDTSEWKEIEMNIDEVIQHPLIDEGISSKYLLSLKKTLDSINTNGIWIRDLYNRYDGTKSNAIEIKYLNEVNGLHFYYKIFEKPLDSIPSEFYDLQTKDSIGGILDKHVIYYYK